MKYSDLSTKHQTTYGELLLYLAYLPLLIILKAFVTMMIWEWYIVAHFGVQSLSLPVAFGINLIGAYIMLRHTTSSTRDTTVVNHLVEVTLTHLTILLLAWIGSLFV
jgi:hypothetical protein